MDVPGAPAPAVGSCGLAATHAVTLWDNLTSLCDRPPEPQAPCPDQVGTTEGGGQGSLGLETQVAAGFVESE